uniref:Uncharacterized protein n=1 Tax=Panagrolaimus davidi TaxID=227884 RepID=A0A914PK52_9BILA
MNNHEFCKAIKEKFTKAEIPTFFITSDDWLITKALVFANYRSKRNDIISMLKALGDEGIVVQDFKYTPDGYIKLTRHVFKTVSDNDKIQLTILKNHPKTIILINFYLMAHMNSLKCLFSKTANLINIYTSEFTDQTIIQTLKQIIDKRCIHYKIRPTCLRKCIIRPKTGWCTCAIITANPEDELPFEKTIRHEKLVRDIIATVENPTSEVPITLFTCTPNLKAHLHEITLKIDEQNFVTFEVKPIICKEIKNLPQKLEKKKNLKIPVIALFRNLSFILIPKNDKSPYEFLQSWNGIYGTDLYLNFDKEKPTFGENAFKSYGTKSNGLVYGFSIYFCTKINFRFLDITKIMASSPEKLQIFSEHFKITKDAENPVLFEIIDHERKEKFATPAFFMALMFKEHLKAIKNEIGRKPKEIGIVFFDEYDVGGYDRVQTQISEACNTLKIECQFV